MLHTLHLKGVGPADELELRLAPRLNVVTGDNGLGKSFLLDAAWWVLTRTWGSYPLEPRDAGKPASIGFEVDLRRGRSTFTTSYDRAALDWKRVKGRPPSPGLVLYARTDGGFGVWDPHRNYWREAPSLGVSDARRPDAFLFTPREVWDGKELEGRPFCNGLIHDWVDWQRTGKDGSIEFQNLREVLQHLSPEPGEEIRPTDPKRIPGDSRWFPTLEMPYGDVPIIHASAGMRRIAALAYLLVWAFSEHLIAAEQLGKPPERRIIFLIDELEAHLHPRWQRVVLPALLGVMDALANQHEGAVADVQLLVTTHSPLLLLSLESYFDEARDALRTLELVNGEVKLEEPPWERRGDASNWLTSTMFDLSTSRSKEAEALEARLDRLDPNAPPSSAELDRIEEEMRNVLGDLDPLWRRWREYRQFLRSRGLDTSAAPKGRGGRRGRS